jgi:hypothetical protein
MTCVVVGATNYIGIIMHIIIMAQIQHVVGVANNVVHYVVVA